MNSIIPMFLASLVRYEDGEHPLPIITNVNEALQELPGYDEDTVRKLLQIDRGPEGGKMVTQGLVVGVKNTQAYELTTNGVKISNQLFPINLEETASHPNHVEAPPFLEVEAEWISTPITSGEGNNILGDNGRLLLNGKNMTIPTVSATNATLGYYGGLLIEKGQSIQFPDAVYPLFKMNIGENYVRDFIYTTEGGGFYLEFHNDQPHFHMPIRGDGYYILAKWNEEKTKLQITAFQIPDGQAVYTKKGAIHCDAALTGDLIVGYTVSEVCSTVLLRTPSDELVHLNFQ